MSDLALGVRLTGNGAELIGAVRKSRGELDRLEGSGRTAGRGLQFAAEKARAFSRHAQTLQRTLFSLKGLLAGLGVGLVARSFVDAAATAEQYQVRLKVLLGSQAEGNRLFRQMAEFAGKVPFEYEQIMGSATQLAGVLRGGVDEIRQWMPLIGDLAAASGLGIQQTTEQVIRMLSAGAAAADLFRERGITAMLGFQAGVSYSAEQTREQLLRAWQRAGSQFRGATQELARTWTGLMSMLSDKWFQFRTNVMDAGLFEYFKALVRVLDRELGEGIGGNREIFRAFARGVINAMEIAGKAVGVFADGIRGVHVVVEVLKTPWLGLRSLIVGVAHDAALVVERMVNAWVDAFNFLVEQWPWLAERMGGPAQRVDLTSSLREGFNDDVNAIRDQWLTIHELMMRPLPSEGIKAFFAEVREEFERLDAAARAAAVADPYRSTPGFRPSARGGAAAPAPAPAMPAAQEAARETRSVLASTLEDFRNTHGQMDEAQADWARGFSDTFTDALLGAREGFTDFALNVVRDLVRIQVQAGITSSLLGSMFGGSPSPNTSTSVADYPSFTLGGVMTPGGARTLPRHAYAHGGIATRPQVALFGEGAMPEAFVPLPDGRSIPVTLRGAGASVVINQSNDFRGVDPSAEARIRQALDLNMQATKAAVFAEINRGGRAAKATGRRF